MKKVTIWVLIVVATAFTPSISNAQTRTDAFVDSVMAELDKTIQMIRENDLPHFPILQDRVLPIEKRREEISDYLKKSLNGSRGLSIDIIPIWHYAYHPKMTDELLAGVSNSQRKAYQILSASNYDLIGWEASAILELSKELFLEDFVKVSKLRGQNFSKDAPGLFDDIVRWNWDTDIILRYWFYHPDAKLCGLQDWDVWKLNLALVRGGAVTYSRIESFRSIVALARMAEVMKVREYQRGAVVMGSDHTQDLVYVMNHYGIKFQIVDQVPGN